MNTDIQTLLTSSEEVMKVTRSSAERGEDHKRRMIFSTSSTGRVLAATFMMGEERCYGRRSGPYIHSERGGK